MKKTMVLMVAGVVMLLASPALADTWDFTPTGGNVGPSETYTGGGGSGNLDITAYGFWANGDPTDLFEKEGGVPGETGLGIDQDPFGGDEISADDFVQLDMSDLVGNSIFGGTFLIGSVQTGESFQVCVGGTLGSLGTCGPVIVGNGANNPNDIVTLAVNWTSNDHFVSITGVNTDVLVASGFEAVPEPATLVLLGTGLVGLGAKVRRRMKKA